MIPTPHINAPEGTFAETVLMPGDPLRSRYFAEKFLEDPVLVNNVRNVQGYTGTYKGKKVSIMASGMGCPSIGIYSYELYEFYGVENIIRLGTAGALSPKLKLRDIVIGMSAFSNSGYVHAFGFDGDAAPCCSWELLSKAMKNAEAMRLNAYAGSLLTSDTFYNEGKISKIAASMGALAVEMETAALYMNAARAGKNALTVCSISDSLVTGESLPAEQRQESLDSMMLLGLSLI